MASIYKRKDSSVWYVAYYQNGKRFVERVGKNKKAAEYRLHEIELEHVRGEITFYTDRPILDFIQKFRIHLETKLNSEAYYKRVEVIINNFVKYMINNNIKTIGEISFEVLDAYMAARLSVDNIKPKTMNMELDYIRNLLNYGINLGYVKNNPALKLKRLRVIAKPPRYFKEDELSTIFDNPGLFETYFKVLLHTGLRAGDAANLTWDNVDLDNGIIHKVMEKTEITVSIPISSNLKSSLVKLRKKNDNLFSGLETDSKRRKARLYLQKLLLLAGFNVYGVGLHTFRHTFASILVMKGVPIYQVSKWLGHKSILMTQVYAHLEPTSGRDQIEKICFFKTN